MAKVGAPSGTAPAVPGGGDPAFRASARLRESLPFVIVRLFPPAFLMLLKMLFCLLQLFALFCPDPQEGNVFAAP